MPQLSLTEQLRILYIQTKITKKIYAALFYPNHAYTMFDCDSKIRTSCSRYNSLIKMHYFRGDRLWYWQYKILDWFKNYPELH